MRISDWSSDVCSSDLLPKQEGAERVAFDDRRPEGDDILFGPDIGSLKCGRYRAAGFYAFGELQQKAGLLADCHRLKPSQFRASQRRIWQEHCRWLRDRGDSGSHTRRRSEEHTSELTSLMRSSYAVFCLKKKKHDKQKK